MEQKNEKLMIFLAGEVLNKRNLLKMIHDQNWVFYAADGGYLLAESLGITPKKIIGDFDSAVRPDRKNILVFPSEKDETDSELALLLAEKDGFKDICMVAPFGGRMDHTVANLCLLESAENRGLHLTLYDGINRIQLVDNDKMILSPHYRYVSFFPWGEEAEISLTDFKYSINHYTLQRYKPIGVSNEPSGIEPTITVHRGKVLCVCVERQEEL